MADHLAADGFKELGYEFVNIDVSFIKTSSMSRISLIIHVIGLLGIERQRCSGTPSS